MSPKLLLQFSRYNTVVTNFYNMVRKRFIPLVFVVFCVANSDMYHTDCRKEDRSILILGGGMAGLSAAKALSDRGFTNFEIMEGTNRIGGRIKSEKLGNYTVELGAMWIYGKGTNPVYKMATESGLSHICGKFPSPNWSVKDQNGDDITLEADTAFEKLDGLVDDLGAAGFDDDDVSVRDMLQKVGWVPEHPWENMVEEYIVGFESGVYADYLSAKHLQIDAPYEEFGSTELMPVNDSRGFEHLIHHLQSSIPHKHQIHFNKHVTKIGQSDDEVIVHTRDGTVYFADLVIVTFSLGVLQQRAVEFSPPLPPWKLAAIDKFGICDFSHIYLQFPWTFWDDASFLVFVSNDKTLNKFWLNMNQVYPGGNILQLSLYDKESKRIDNMSDGEVVTELISVLQRMYPKKQVPFPIDFKISRWSSDPFFRGSFSYWPSHFESTDMDDLSAPYGQIYFAGEHLSHKQYGYVHSAYMSGIKAANELLDLLATNDSCWKVFKSY